MLRLKTPSILAMTAVALVTVALLLFSSCGSVKPLVPTIKDSTSVTTTTTTRDTSVVAPSASTSFSVSLADVLKAIKDQDKPMSGYQADIKQQPISLGNSTSKQARASASIEDGALKVACTCDTVAIEAKLYDKVVKEYKARTIIPAPVQVKYVPWYITALAWIGGGVLGLVLVMLIYRYIKSKVKK